ncbi:MAG TPA: PEGA domain-containing protein [Kofleriaceae bacterium]|jgi:hypothetical protein
MKRALLLLIVAALASAAHADPNPHRKVVVLEYRSGSSAVPGIAGRLVAALSKKTSLEVLSEDQTRTQYGDHLDQVIVKCGGDATCIGRIGQKVGAAEVILVGISELGDVILTMQRIDVADKSVATRIADSLPSGAVPSDAQLDSYLTKLLPPSDFLRFGVLDIIANQTGAKVFVGGQPRGATPIPSLKLQAPADYRVRVEKSGFNPFTTTVHLPPDGALRLDANLSRKSSVAWYGHWYVIAAASIIAASAVGVVLYEERDQIAGSDTLHWSGGLN